MSQAIVANNKPAAVELEAGKKYFFCSCGRSATQPFCDGKHAGSPFRPQAFTAEKTGTAYLCACKQSKNFPYCDGSHAQIPDGMIGREFKTE